LNEGAAQAETAGTVDESALRLYWLALRSVNGH